MTEYIKRSDAIAEINRGDLLVGNNAEWAREIIWRTPYADVVEVTHGHWIVLGQRTYGGGRCYTHYCSECGQHGYDDYKVCPNCGAKMDGGKN